MLNSTNLLTVADCDTAITKVTEEKVAYEARKYSLNRQIPNLEGAQDVAALIASLQSDINGITTLIESSTNEDFVDDLTKKKNNFQNKLIDLQNRAETSVLAIKVEKYLDLDVAETAIAAATAALDAYTARRAQLVANAA
jgi:gamma-glutamylcysteine synthetase